MSGASSLKATRRDFLRISAVSAGGLALGVRFARAAEEAAGEFRPNVWVRIDTTGKVVLTVDKSEMGQGVRTSLPMILAEELEVDVDSVELFQASPGPDFQDMGTYGSRSTRTLWLPLRTAGAAAREMLVAAAAAKWAVEPASCRAEKGRVLHPPSKRSLGYGELAAAAGRLPVPAAPALKPRKDWRIIGKDRRRVDGPKIAAGEATFASDVQRPGMKVATVIRCPVVGGKPKSWDEAKARAVAGVRMVAPIASGLAVIGDDTWAALAGREALEPTVVWDEGANAAVGSAEVLASLRAGLEKPGRALSRGSRCGGRDGGGRAADRGRLLLPVPGPRPDGADERGRRRLGRTLRDLGGHAGAQLRAVGGGEAARHPRVGRDGQRDAPRGRIRTPRPDRLRARRRRGLERGAGAGQGAVDPSGRHAQRGLPPDLAPPHDGGARRVRRL